MININVEKINTNHYSLFRNKKSVGSYKLKHLSAGDVVSFQKKVEQGLTEAEQKYIKNIKQNLEQQGKRLHSISQLDLSKIPNLCKGIKVFEGWTPENLALFSTNLYSVSLQSGCANHCDHCYIDAGIKISNMKWNNYKELVDGMQQVIERLGFNPFLSSYNQTKLRNNLVHSIALFSDSDPMWYKAVEGRGINEEVNVNIYDAARYLKDKTGLKTKIITAGWNQRDEQLQKGAEELAKHPEVVDGKLLFSIHPFHQLMHNSIHYAKLAEEALKKGNSEQASRYEGISKQKRQEYVYRLASNIATFIKNDFPTDKLMCTVYFSDENVIYSKEEALKLESELYATLEELVPQKREILEKIRYSPGEISLSAGRAKSFFDMESISKNTINTWIRLYNEKFPEKKFVLPDDFFNKTEYSELENVMMPIIEELELKHSTVVRALKPISDSNTYKIADEKLVEELGKEDILYRRKTVGIDGDVMLELPNRFGVMAKMTKLPFKLNFSEKTEWKSEKPKYIELSHGRIDEVFGKLTKPGNIKRWLLRMLGKEI